MELSLPYYLVFGYLIYIIGLTAIPIIRLFIDFLRSFSSKKYKYIKSKNCNFCSWFKTKLLKERPKEQLSLAFFVTGIGSVFFSAGIMMFSALYPHSDNIYYNQLLSLFVGLWAPNLILLSLYLKK